MRLRRSLFLASQFLSGLALAAACGQAEAGALRVSPVGLDLPAGRTAATLTLRNDDAAPMNIQLRVFRWTQGPEGDELVPTDEVAVSPPIAPLAARSERVVRLVRLSSEAQAEASYRVIVDELPPPPNSQAQQVRLLMRHSIPVFFTPSTGATPKVTWSLGPSVGGDVTLHGVNAGRRRIRIAELKLLDAAGAVVARRPGLVGYVLAGATISWSIPLERPGAGAPARLTADTDAGPLDIPLPSNL